MAVYTFKNRDLGRIVNGVFDILFAFSLAIERKGLLGRPEIAEILATVKDQADAQEGGRTARTVMAEAMLAVFAAPLPGAQTRAQFQVVDGDRR